MLKKFNHRQKEILLNCLENDHELRGSHRQPTFPEMQRRTAEALSKHGLVVVLPPLHECFAGKTTSEVEAIIGRRLTMGDLPQGQRDFRVELTDAGRAVAEELNKFDQVAEVHES